MKNSLAIPMCTIATTSLLFLSTCKKESLKCEEWEVEDAKHNIGGCIDWSCAGSRSYHLIFCGESLKEARAGNTIVLSEDQCCKRTRTFIRFIQKVQ